MDDGARVTFRQRAPTDEDTALDTAVLDVETDSRVQKQFLELDVSPLKRGMDLAVVGFQSKRRADSLRISVGMVRASVLKSSARHLLMPESTFQGAQGAAVVLLDDKLVAMNMAGINLAKDRLKAPFKAPGTINETTPLQHRTSVLRHSVDSLVGDLAQGSLAVLASTFAHSIAPPA